MGKLIDWWNRLMGKRTTTTTTTTVKPPTFVENFTSIDSAKWLVSTWTAPGKSATHSGSFAASNVSITPDGLCLKLSQKLVDGVFVSSGAEISTLQKFGYGTYEFVVKASASAAGLPVSGSITGCFSYLSGSATEIDMEVEGNFRSNLTQFTSWASDASPNQHTEFPCSPGPHAAFIAYKYIWAPGKIEFFRNGVLLSTHTQVVPTQAAPMMFNHWGTNNPGWGGVSTPDVDRYMYVKSFKFTPL